MTYGLPKSPTAQQQLDRFEVVMVRIMRYLYS